MESGGNLAPYIVANYNSFRSPRRIPDYKMDIIN